MKCEICKKKEASVHFKQVHEGEAKELFVCEECAASKGFDVQAPMSLANFLFGGDAEGAPDAPGDERICTLCRMRLSDFRKGSRLGCPVCYETFSEELRPMLASMQKGKQHRGKIPFKEKIIVEILQMKECLNKAVASQDFESAAALRDQIKVLETAASGKAVRTAGDK